MSDDERLRQLQAAVGPHAVAASVRGDGRAAFVFAEGAGGAVEAGRTGGRWWVEFWDGRAGNDTTPAKELLADTDAEALAAIIDWLR